MAYTQGKSLRRGWMFFAATVMMLLMLVLGANTTSAADASTSQYSAPVPWQEDEGDGGGEDRPRFYGLVEQMPEGGRSAIG